MDSIKVFDIPPRMKDDRRAAGVIVAAGSFTRMGGVAKQTALLGDMPVIAHSIKAFQDSENIREIVVVSRPDDMSRFMQICIEYGFDKVRAIVAGGDTRQQSVFNGIGVVKGGAAYFAIHDGARPLIKPETIDRVIEEGWKYGAATAAVPTKNTIKVSDKDGFVVSTPDRRFLWSIQTPQVFKADLYLKAMENASVNGCDFTDDCQLVEQLGSKVYLVNSEYDNIKITTPEDIAVAGCLLEHRMNTHS
jgi:2-C-methyl-D-erythritol 4-phosphate cytidylyltransferase